jgi:hypothetical protein
LRIGIVQLLPSVVVVKDTGVVGRGSMRSVIFRYRRLSEVVLKNPDVICWHFGDALCHFGDAMISRGLSRPMINPAFNDESILNSNTTPQYILNNK